MQIKSAEHFCEIFKAVTDFVLVCSEKDIELASYNIGLLANLLGGVLQTLGEKSPEDVKEYAQGLELYFKEIKNKDPDDKNYLAINIKLKEEQND